MADVTMDIASNGSLQTAELDALVIGVGFAGLYQLLCLSDRLELSKGAGGGRRRHLVLEPSSRRVVRFRKPCLLVHLFPRADARVGMV
jgi:hypothetical protein